MQEVDFLCTWFCEIQPTGDDIFEYVQYTVFGKGDRKLIGMNPLFQGKRLLDMTIKMWTEDLSNGLIGYDELREHFNCEFFDKMIDSIMGKIIKTKQYNRNESIPIISSSNRIVFVSKSR